MDEAEKEFKDKDDDVNAAARRCVLMEGEATVSVEKLATTVMKLALMSKEADNIIKGARHWESKNMNNEMEIETLETNLKEAKRIASDNEMKSDNLARSLAMMEDELKRAEERVKIAEERVVKIEDELSAIGENQKQLEISEEKARRSEEKYQDQIKQLNIRLKESDSRSEYAGMNITKLHLRIDELEDEIIREKLKINAVSGQLDDTFNEMLNKYCTVNQREDEIRNASTKVPTRSPFSSKICFTRPKIDSWLAVNTLFLFTQFASTSFGQSQ